MNTISPLSMSLLFLFLSHERASGSQDNSKSYNEILNSVKYPDKLVFDVNEPLNNTLDEDPNFEDFQQLGVSLSQIVYWRQDENGSYANYTHELTTEQQIYDVMSDYPPKFSLCLGNGSQHSESFYSIFTLTREYFESPHRHYWRDMLIGIMDTFRNIFRGPQSAFPMQEVEFGISHSRWQTVRLGLDWDNRDGIYQNLVMDLIGHVEVIIVTFDVPPMFPLSYSMFKEDLQTALHKIHTLVQSIQNENQKCRIYAKLNFHEKKSDSDFNFPGQLFQKYYFYLLQFSVFLINDGGKVGLIMPSFNQSLGFKQGLEGLHLRQISDINFLSGRIRGRTGECFIKAWLYHVAPHFGSVFLRGWLGSFDDKYKCVLLNAPDCPNNLTEREVCGRPSGLPSVPDITRKIEITFDEFDPSGYANQMKKIPSQLKGLPWKALEFSGRQEPNVIKEFFKPDVTIVCGISQDNFRTVEELHDYKIIERVYETCGSTWNESDYIVLEIGFASKDAQTWVKGLQALDMIRGEFTQRFPEKAVIPRVKPALVFGSPSLYCEPVTIRDNQIVEMVIHFARVHNISFRSQFWEPWTLIETMGEVEMAQTRFPVFVARNYPEKFLLSGFHTDPCMTWTESIDPGNGTRIDLNHAGTTVYMAGWKGNGSASSSLSRDELKTMLRQAFHRFSLVELIPTTLQDLRTVVEVLDKIHPKEGAHIWRLYVKVDCNLFNDIGTGLQSLFKKLARVSFKPTGVHLANWPTNIKDILFRDNNKKVKPMLVGLSLEDCIEEVNNQFSTLKTLQPIDNIDYLLCSISQPVEATNIETLRMKHYLDTTLYIEKYFQRLFPSDKNKNNGTTELLFRLNTKPSSLRSSLAFVTVNGKETRVTRDVTTNYLAFFSDVSQYAKLYEKKFFVGPAFDDPSGRMFGWWKVTDFDSLTNITVFVGKDAEVRGKETSRPDADDLPLLELDPWTTSLFISVATAVGLLVLAGMALLLCFIYRRRIAILTKEEVEDFRNGRAENGHGDVMKPFENLKFPKEFEMERHGFELANVIGRGEFGLVYSGKLSTGGLAAVKLPKSNCPNAFKSMLSELKVLCYVGDHPHVIRFMGACIKEIKIGIVYIVTEFCTNGSLLEYLRNVQSLYEANPEMEMKNVYELRRFSQEVANGMEFIASKKIVHGDLSARNILLDSDLNCKISDFGLSRKLYEYQKYIKENSEPLPWRWMAVESLKRMEFTTKSDVWSYGITLWEIFSLGCVPYPGQSWNVGFLDDLENGIRMKSPRFSSAEIYGKMMLACWNIDPELRPSFEDICQFFLALREEDYIEL